MVEEGPVRITVVARDGAVVEERSVSLPVTFGRAPDQADIVLADRMVSRRHARLEHEGDVAVVEDLDSENGTWVGNERVARRVLGPGEALTLGTSTVRWSRVRTPLPEPDLGSAWCVVVGENGLEALPLHGLSAAWRAAARQVDELTDATTLDDLLDGDIARLAHRTLAACEPTTDPGAFRAGLVGLRALPEHARAVTATPAIRRDDDRRLLAALAAALHDGAAAFVRYGPATPTAGASSLVAALRAVLTELTEHDRRLASTRAEAMQ